MASQRITAARTWTPIDIDGICRNYSLDKNGVAFRYKATAAAVEALVTGINHLLAYNNARISFQQCCDFETRQVSGVDPLYQWTLNEQNENGRVQHWRMVIASRSSGTGNAYAHRYGYTSVRTPYQNYTAYTPQFPADCRHTMLEFVRGGARGLISDALTTVNGYSIIDVCVQDEPTPTLDITIDDVALGGAVSGQEIVANVIEDLRQAFYAVRANYLPVLFSWSAQGATGSPASPSAIGCVSGSATFTNVLDNASATRTADSPGIMCNALRAGRGDPSKTDGTKVPVALAILARISTSPSGTGEYRIIGPDHVASNQVDITGISATTATWYTSGSDRLYMNSTVGVDDVTTARNKIDVLGRVTNAADDVYCYAIRGWQTIDL